MPPNSWQVGKELGMVEYDLDSQAFSSPAADVKRLELAALYTLQHGLSGDAESEPCFEHRQILWRRLFDEARAQRVGDPDAPRCAWGELLADDDPGDQPAVQRGRCHAEDRGGLRDGDELAIGALGGRLTARDAAIAAQVAHMGRGKALAARGASTLAIEDGRQ